MSIVDRPIADFTGTDMGNMPVPHGVRLHRFTVDEYERIGKNGVLDEDDPVELIEGLIVVKPDHGPPYDVPLGIPPEVLIDSARQIGAPLRKFTVREYHRMLDAGVFAPDLRHELAEGWVVDKMTRGSKHDSALQRLAAALLRRIGTEWTLRLQSALAMDDGEPEPDLVVVPGPVGRFDHAHPRPHEAGLVVEIADATLSYDRTVKLRMYARNYVAIYWIVNLLESQIEVHSDPSGPTDSPEFRQRSVWRRGQGIGLTLREMSMGEVAVDELLPRD